MEDPEIETTTGSVQIVEGTPTDMTVADETITGKRKTVLVPCIPGMDWIKSFFNASLFLSAAMDLRCVQITEF